MECLRTSHGGYIDGTLWEEIEERVVGGLQVSSLSKGLRDALLSGKTRFTEGGVGEHRLHENSGRQDYIEIPAEAGRARKLFRPRGVTVRNEGGQWKCGGVRDGHPCTPGNCENECISGEFFEEPSFLGAWYCGPRRRKEDNERCSPGECEEECLSHRMHNSARYGGYVCGGAEDGEALNLNPICTINAEAMAARTAFPPCFESERRL